MTPIDIIGLRRTPAGAIVRANYRGHLVGGLDAPLAVVLVHGESDEWYVLHRASGRSVGPGWRSCVAAIAYAGALYATTTNWREGNPAEPDAGIAATLGEVL